MTKKNYQDLTRLFKMKILQHLTLFYGCIQCSTLAVQWDKQHPVCKYLIQFSQDSVFGHPSKPRKLKKLNKKLNTVIVIHTFN